MHVNTVHTAALAKITKPAVVHPGKILPGKLLFSLRIFYDTWHLEPDGPDESGAFRTCAVIMDPMAQGTFGIEIVFQSLSLS